MLKKWKTVEYLLKYIFKRNFMDLNLKLVHGVYCYFSIIVISLLGNK
jgi:hypothetical protein